MNYYDARKFGKRIKELRKENKMTQAQLAQQLMLSVDSISNIENGKTTCMPEYVMIICQIFNVSTDYLYFGKRKELYDNNIEDDIIVLIKEKSRGQKRKAYRMLKLMFEEEII